ncbi:hypothetical protein EVAR_68171_1 [Eumeta japonica]|uniref:Uncharacterized protein n=1 Tax=Eumeta variegata TaxID=151549 RepID=A0A4C1SZ86_EUMVA|nr:hypothetical protein EVAR_68171_1 [Eumeta japonica]
MRETTLTLRAIVTSENVSTAPLAVHVEVLMPSWTSDSEGRAWSNRRRNKNNAGNILSLVAEARLMVPIALYVIVEADVRTSRVAQNVRLSRFRLAYSDAVSGSV